MHRNHICLLSLGWCCKHLFQKGTWVVRGTLSFGPMPALIIGRPFSLVQRGHPLCPLSWGANYDGQFFQSWQRSELSPASACGWNHMHGSSNISALHQTLFILWFLSQEPGARNTEAWKLQGQEESPLSICQCYHPTVTWSLSQCPQVVGHQDKKVTQLKSKFVVA